MKRLLIAFLATACFHQTSFAAGADVTIDEGRYGDFSGVYAGAQLGASKAQFSAFGTTAFSDPYFFGGGHVGFLLQRDRFVGGAELSADFGDIEGFSTRAVRAKARFGVAVGERGIVTPFVGATFLDVDGFNDTFLNLGVISEIQVTERLRMGTMYTADFIDTFSGLGVDGVNHTLQLRASVTF